MKKISVITICIVLLIFSSALAAPRSGQQPEGICTRDLNLWGHASRCSCQDGKVYDSRAGLCLVNTKGEMFMVQGAILADMAAIGGETTGISIETEKDGTYELILQSTDQEKLKKLNGMWFEVVGEFIIIESVEIKERRAIIVEKLAVLE